MIAANKQIIAKRFGKQVNLYKKHAMVQREICNTMVDFLLHSEFQPKQVLEIGCGVGFLTEDFLQKFTVQTYTANDIAPEMEGEIRQIAAKTAQSIQFIAGDAEAISFGNNFDMVISASTLQWFHNVPVFFKNITKALASNGIFAISSFGERNFEEIKTLTGNSLHYYSAEKLCELLSTDFQILHCENYCKTLYFETPTDVLRHIKQTGVNNFEPKRWTKLRLQQFSEAYCAQFSSQKGVSLTYNPIIIVAQKRK